MVWEIDLLYKEKYMLSYRKTYVFNCQQELNMWNEITCIKNSTIQVIIIMIGHCYTLMSYCLGCHDPVSCLHYHVLTCLSNVIYRKWIQDVDKFEYWK